MAAADYTSLVQSLYVSYFGRPADSFALANFAAQLDALKAPTTSSGLAAAYKTSAGLKSLIDSFGTSQESKDLYGTDDLGFVTSIYRNAFNREPDFEGLMFWTNAIRSGSLSKANAALTIVAESVNNISLQGKSDAALIANKVTVAANFTAAIDTGAELAAYNGNAAAATARAMLSAVTATTLAVDLQANVEATLATLVANANPGVTSSLTIGQDTLVGTAGNDVFNAFSFNSVSGGDAKTLNSFDSIDGGAGRDTLNIQLQGAAATTGNTLAELGTIKNVEIINITGNTATVVDASKFVGATAINQIGGAGAVTGLAAGATAGFNSIASGALSVTAADTATSAAVVLKDVNETASLTVNANATGALNSVTVSGNRVDGSDAGTSVSKLSLTVVAGKDVESVSINTATGTTLASVANAAGSTKALSTVDASASTAAISYVAASTVAAIKTGAGNDVVTNAFAGTATVKAASLSTGAGNDTLTVNVTKGAATAVTAAIDAGAGNDTVNLTIAAGVTYNVVAGAGNDTVSIVTGTIKTTDVIDGGEGTDTIGLAGKASYVSDDYIVLNKVLKGFEAVEFTTAAGTTAAFDASQAAGYKDFTFDLGGEITKVAADQALATAGDLTATAAGYAAATATADTTYAGALHITAEGGSAGTAAVGTPGNGLAPTDPAYIAPSADYAPGTAAVDVIVSAFAQSVALTVSATTTDSFVALEGDVKTAVVTLANAANSATAPTADTIAHFDLVTGVTTAPANLTTLTLSGNGSAVVVNSVATALTTVDASGLGGVFTLGAAKGAAIAGLNYTSFNAAAETIKLGAGLDHIDLRASIYGDADSISGLNLVLNAAGTALDLAKSDVISVAGVSGAVKFTTTQTDLDLALKDASAFEKVAGTASENVVFQLGGNTYIFHDAGTLNQVDVADTVVKLVGNIDLDALIIALA